jgi:hypothetical protein
MFLNDKPEIVIFHYNKKHNEDSSVPPWIIKFKGKTHYISHFDISPGVGFSSKETPSNGHTKGSMKMKGLLELYDVNGKTFAKVS